MILIINTGSSSIKFQLYKIISKKNFKIICKGLIELIENNGIFTIKFNNKKIKTNEYLPDYNIATKILINKLKEHKIINNLNNIKGIGHRIVHGGEKFVKSLIINNKILIEIENMITLAPLHNKNAIIVIKNFIKIFNIPNIAVFDTSFHTTIPEENYLYSVPYEWYINYKVRRYGFHGISYRYITKRLSIILKKSINKINAIICHLGNGSSICSIKNGKSFNTTMGLTPLEGLIMGTRSGDIDPSIFQFIANKTGITLDEITNILNKKSGLLGISGISSDLRDIFKSSINNKRSKLALLMSVKRIAKYIICYINEMKIKPDAIVFTAGIGENSYKIRKLIIKEINLLNLKLSNLSNKKLYNEENLISDKKSDIPIYAIKTNEEIIICEDTYNLINQ